MKLLTFSAALTLTLMAAAPGPVQAITCGKGATLGATLGDTPSDPTGNKAHRGTAGAANDCATTGYMNRQKKQQKTKPGFNDQMDEEEQIKPDKYRKSSLSGDSQRALTLCLIA